MAVKIQLRRGNASAVPALDVGEPGFDIDVNTLRVGDGTGSPPRIPTTKSTGSFSFLGVTYFQVPQLIVGLGLNTAVSLYFNPSDSDTGLYSPGANQVTIATGGADRIAISNTGIAITGNLTITPGGLIDTVDISGLNPTGVNGIVVKKSDNLYAMRNLVPGNGIAPMLNASAQANSGGAAGDIIISIATNPTIPGNGGIKIPAGPTGNQSDISAVNGHFRYNATGNYFEGYIDGQWRAIVDYVQGHTAYVPSQFASIQAAVNYYASRSTQTNVVIQLPAGTTTITSAISPGSLTSRIFIQGQPPVYVALNTSTPVLAVTGSSGNYLVQYKLAAPVPAGITTDSSLVVHQLNGSGDVPFYEFNGTQGLQVISGQLSTVASFNTTVPITSMYAPNDYIMMAVGSSPTCFRRVTAIVDSNHMTVDAPFPEPSNTGNGAHRKLRALTGTSSTTYNSGTKVTTLTGSGTAYLTQLNVGDVLVSYTTKTFMEVTAIASNTSATVKTTSQANASTLITGEILLQFIASGLHIGCWKISSIDTIGQTVTVINTTFGSVPPPLNGFYNMTVTFLPTNVLFTSGTAFSLATNQFIGLSNLNLRYTGSSPTSNPAAVYSQGGDLTLSGVIGIVNGRVELDYGGELSANRMFISGLATANSAALVANAVSVNAYQLATTGNNGAGTSMSNSSLVVTALSDFSGNNGRGLQAYSSPVNVGTLARVHYNSNPGVWVSQSQFSSTWSYWTIGNGGANFYATNGSSSNFVGVNVFLSAVGDGVINTNMSFFGVSYGTIVSGNTNNGITTAFNSLTTVSGVQSNSNGAFGLQVRTGSRFYALNSTGLATAASALIYGNGSHNTWVIEGGYMYLEYAKFSGASSAYYDVVASNFSNVNLFYAVSGSGASNSVSCTPALNGAASRLNSFIYSQAHA